MDGTHAHTTLLLLLLLMTTKERREHCGVVPVEAPPQSRREPLEVTAKKEKNATYTGGALLSFYLSSSSFPDE